MRSCTEDTSPGQLPAESRGRVLVVDDDPDMCLLLEANLCKRGFQVFSTDKAVDAVSIMEAEDVDVVLTDLMMPDLSGIELCDRIASKRPDLPVVVVTAFGSVTSAIQAIRAGAYDFVVKPYDVEALVLALQRAVRHHQLREQVARLSPQQRKSGRFEELIGESDMMNALCSTMISIANSEASVLISGESGTGKELIARAIHRKSRRSHFPFVAINCAAVPETLLESELFGHVKGAFTDASTERKGLLFQAQGGTLFLDEIADLPLSLQPKLLRVLEERLVRPVGGDEALPIDVRIVAATNHDLDELVKEKRFREDLYFRLNVLPVVAPPLRSRGNDILLLAQHFLEEVANQQKKAVSGISPPVARKLLEYEWPGNVRELKNAIERAVALTEYRTLVVADLPEKIQASRRSDPFPAGQDLKGLVPLNEIERRYIIHVLESAGGNKALAAKLLGLDRKTLYRKLALYQKKA